MTLHKLSLCGSLACGADDLSVLLKMCLQAEAAGTRNMPTSHGFILIKLITREQADCGIYASCLSNSIVIVHFAKGNVAVC